NRLAGERVAFQILLERLALPAVPRRLGARHALPHDRLALTPFHLGSVPAWRRSRERSELESWTPSTRLGGNSRWRKSASTRTPSCACRHRRSRSSTTTSSGS